MERVSLGNYLGSMRVARFPDSIRARLIMVPLTVLAGAMVLAVIVSSVDSNSRIRAETRSGTELGATLLGYAMNDLEAAPDPQASITRLMTDLGTIRHVRFVYRSAGGLAAASGDPPLPASRDRSAPDWFVALFQVRPYAKRFPISIRGNDYGEIVMVGYPRDEIAEIWGELAFLLSLLGVISILIMAALLIASHAALRPIASLARGLERMSVGEFAPLGPFGVMELDPLRAGFNHLAVSLQNAELDNRLLIDRLLSVQESERSAIARELHDDFGATLFGARAELSMLIDRARRLSEGSEVVVERATAVSGMIDDIQQQNVRILERLRPMALAHMDAASAARDVVATWAARHPAISVKTEIAPDLMIDDADIGLAIYRTVQECLTNIDRHAAATEVSVALSWATDAEDDTTVSLIIEDDGIGLPKNFRKGFGLLGMSERVRRSGGRLELERGARGGVRVKVLLDLARATVADGFPA